MNGATLEQRVGRLERQNRRLRMAMLAVVVGLAALVSLGAAARPGVVDGTRFVLRDDAGHVRAVLAVVDGAMRSHLPIDVASAGPMLALYDSKGAVRATLGVA